MPLSNCCCGGCGCSVCQPANVIYRSQCTDPGSVVSLNHISGLDAQFCNKRLLPGEGGFLFAEQNSSGSWIIKFSPSPTIILGDQIAVLNQTFGKLVVNGSDNIQRQLTGPSTAGLTLTTNASGDLIFTTFPTQNTPDPLTVNTINAANFTLGSGTFTGTPVFTGLATTAIVSVVGLDAAGNLVKGTPATSLPQGCMFFEAPTSPSAATPNAGATAGSALVIGNLLFDSTLPAVPGGALISATNSQTLTVLTAGWYSFEWCGQVQYTNPTTGNPAIILLINAAPVNNGDSRPSAALLNSVRNVELTGFHMRHMAAGDTIQLQLASTSGTNLAVYEVRLNAVRYGA